MKPYFEEDGITIYCGDCREILPSLSPVDLVLTDPPYNVGIDYGEGTNDKRDDFKEWMAPILLECLRSKTVLLTPGQVRLADYSSIYPWKWLLCWWKPAAMGRSPVGFCNWEPVAMWGKGSTSGCDFVRAPIVPDQALDGHPCPKPLEWAAGLISLFPDAKTILDPFMGSGTTLRAAKDLGRKAIGIEINERYCEIAAKRLSQKVLEFA